ncbi:histone demethylase JARID1 [Cladophialophora psammophila CBS 110553]|uniref:Histone demethylase JARID1 n=1 Tax=Cladophialophora psammophila CBS 110553 TaxID=1182543 RepID=W9X7P0_9EURO|nr:histone demethylase JARID1 [Cladophialophora psammophila CBS 110553]EXJ76492.1 histone demethylase JARID1 [Cladophialophora psammophila CBS 110553]
MVAPPSTGGVAPQAPTIKPSSTASRMNGAPPVAMATPSFPYSARYAPPLDLRTVERKGHASSRDPPARRRLHDLPEAPTFRPTEAEFRDPMEYIRSISEKASKYGICKIIPPENWNPDFAIDTERFHFRTRRQEINLVEGGNRTNLNYLDQLAKFHKQYGAHLNRFPSVDKRPLDLYKLKKAVEVRGGFERVCKDKKWAEIGRDLGYSGKIMSSLSTSLKNSYQRWLHPYEEWLKYAKPGVQQQLDHEHGGAYSPSVTPHQPGINHPPPSQSVAPATTTDSPKPTPARSLTPQIPNPPGPSQQQPPVSSIPPAAQPRAASSSSFTAVNSGFTAVNSPSGFTAVNSVPPPVVKKEVNGVPASTQSPAPSFPSINGPTITTIQMPNGTSNPLKRTMSLDSLNGESGSEGLDGEGDVANGRRSKRPKKDVMPTIPGNHIPAMRPTTPQVRTKTVPRRHGEKCEKCGKSDNKESILVCDSCDTGYHKHCVEPPLNHVPEYDWHCSKCLVGTNDYGFEEGSIYSLKQFQEKANNFKDHYFSARMPFDPVSNTQRKPTEDDVEREFWRLVEDITESVEVEYGADIHSTTHGSGFPTVEKNPLDPYSKDPWNLNVMPFLEESLFRHIKGDISGMTVPWLYVGMCFSTFCWHNEDHYAYSANYQHFGATKTWYGIPGKDAYRFEDAMRKAVPELFETQPDLLFQLVTILPPHQLRKAGVEVYALDQRAGQFVITFPQAYHAGFNHGFNFNEAVNFAPADWEPFGEAGVQRLQEFRRQPCFSHDELLFTAAASDGTIRTAKWLGPALERTRARELAERQGFVALHKRHFPHDDCTFDTLTPEPTESCGLIIKVENVELEEDEYQCCYCKAFSYLSQFRCHRSGKVTCLLHPEVADCCSASPSERLRGPNHSLTVRYTNQELSNIVQKVVDRANVPEAWEAKVEALLADEARPALRSMHTLLTEGEKIPCPLKGLDDLADFVKKCDQWVDEANLYLTRKQQNRRKNDKSWRRSSLRSGKAEDKDTEPQLTVERMKELIEDGELLGFTAPQLESLREKVTRVDEWRTSVNRILAGQHQATPDELDALLEEGRGFVAAMPELTSLEQVYARTNWLQDVQKVQKDVQSKTLDDCKELLKRATELEITPQVPEILFLTEVVRQGEFWEIKAKEVMAAEDVHYPQLESLHSQVQNQVFPVNKETLEQMDVILAKNREAKRQIITLVERSHDPDFRKRPMYVHVRDVVKSFEDLNGKPHGASDLEKELRRHEDWMRRGKKLFGKANAPLHILEQHMKFVEEKNNYCFDLNDTFRPPVEPASREATPIEGQEKGALGDEEKPVFCICRQPEAGLMIECEICHDWYHAKCLKLARGKVKECEMFTCPICDWRVKIPRDAARPKLEDLQAWQDEIQDLPFQPEEEDLLKRIIDKAQAFREFLMRYTTSGQLCRTIDEMPEMLFYLRKIEGAEVLLAYETNVLRQELHKWQPIAPEPPPILDQSLSTRKPRPTKQQKLMKELGVEKPEDLPPHLRTKTYVRRKTQESFVTGPLLPKPSTQSPSAPGSAASPSQNGATAEGSSAMQRQESNDNAGPSRTFEAGFISGSSFAERRPSPFSPNSPTLFSPTREPPHAELRDPMMPAFGGDNSEGRNHDPSFPMFRSDAGLGLDGEDDIASGLSNASASAPNSARGGSSSGRGEYDNMFMDMTNPDADTSNEPVPSLEQEAGHASEALDMIRTASNDSASDHGDSEDGDNVSKHFDDFINGDEQT